MPTCGFRPLKAWPALFSPTPFPRRWAHVQGVAARARGGFEQPGASADSRGEACAVIEAEERGQAVILRRESDLPPQSLADALTCCDMTTSPDGEHVHVERRLAEIHDRYGSGQLVSRSIRRATPMILQAVGQVNAGPASTPWAL